MQTRLSSTADKGSAIRANNNIQRQSYTCSDSADDDFWLLSACTCWQPDAAGVHMAASLAGLQKRNLYSCHSHPDSSDCQPRQLKQVIAIHIGIRQGQVDKTTQLIKWYKPACQPILVREPNSWLSFYCVTQHKALPWLMWRSEFNLQNMSIAAADNDQYLCRPDLHDLRPPSPNHYCWAPLRLKQLFI